MNWEARILSVTELALSAETALTILFTNGTVEYQKQYVIVPGIFASKDDFYAQVAADLAEYATNVQTRLSFVDDVGTQIVTASTDPDTNEITTAISAPAPKPLPVKELRG